MRIYIDCEFNGFGGQLVSMAMVPHFGSPFYEVLHHPAIWDEWCFENVLPVLGKEPIDVRKFRAKFFDFIESFNDPVVVADWPADLLYFLQMMQGDSYSETVMVECAMQLVGCDYVSAVPHNALEDAKAIMAAIEQRP